MPRSVTQSYVRVSRDEYQRLKKLETRFAEFFEYVNYLRDIKDAREDMSAGRTLAQEELFQKLGF